MGEPACILIVDDDPNQRVTLVDILTLEGYLAISAATGKEALQLAQEYEVSVALIDLQLTDMPGLKVLRTIKALSADIECILVTGFASQDSAIDALNAGSYSYLQKPFETDRLLLLIRHAVEQHDARLALRESQNLYSTFLDGMKESAFLKDEKFKYILSNKMHQDSIGRKLSEIINYSDYDIFGAEIANEFRRLDELVLKQKGVVVEVHNFGGRIFETRKFPVPLKNGGIGIGGYSRDVTESKFTDDWLRVQSAALEAAANAIAIMDSNGVIQWVNQAFTQLTGYSREEAIGQTGSILRSGLYEETFYDEMWKTIRAGKFWRKEVVNRRKDGTLYPEDETITPLVDDSGKISYFIDIKQDISERNQIETELKKRATQMALINDVSRKIAAELDLQSLLGVAAHLVHITFNYHHVGLFTYDAASKLLTMKATAGYFTHVFPPNHQIKLGQGLVGRAAESGAKMLSNQVKEDPDYINHFPEMLSTQAELSLPLKIGKRLLGVLDVQSPNENAFNQEDLLVLETLADQMAIAMDNAALYQKAQSEIEVRQRSEKDLLKRVTELELLYESGLVFNKLGEPKKIAQKLVDLMQEKLRWQYIAICYYHPEEQLLELLALHVHDGKVTSEKKNIKKSINDINASMSIGISGWVVRHGQSVLSNDPTHDVRYVEVVPGIQCGMYVPIQMGGKVFGLICVESEIKDAFSQSDLHLTETLASQAAIAFENSGLYVEVQKELTERKKAEEELLIHRNNLELLVQERTAQFQKAKEEAELASREKSDFLAMMSHEIRTPLNGVIGLTSLALETKLDERQQNYLHQAQASGEYLLATINDILDFSKIEAGKLELETQQFELDDVLRSVSDMLARRADEKNLEFIFHTSPGIPRGLRGDPVRLRQILLNLVSNAIKFTATGDVVLKVDVLEKTLKNTLIRFSVKDKGIGMTEEQISRLFVPFMQADTSITRRYGGTGLGLTITHRLVSLMKGEIKVISEEGKGSEFIVDLRFEYNTATNEETQILYPFMRNLRVLLIEDNLETRKFLTNTLQAFACDVKATSFTAQGLSLLKKMSVEQPYHAILIDRSLMENNSKLNIIRHIREELNLADPPVIILLGDSLHTGEDGGSKADAYLQKPVTATQLLDALSVALGFEANTRKEQVRKKVTTGVLKTLPGKRILVVEDNTINQWVAKEMLQNLGVHVTLANHGEEALQLLADQSKQFDAILMDIQMPGMDGYQTTALIRQQREYAFAKLPIIATTAHALIGEREKALDAGLNDYLPKPLDMEMLINTLLRWLSPSPTQPVTELPSAQVVEQENAVVAEMPQGLDSAAALARLGGNQPLYFRLLGMFRANQAGTALEIRQAFKKGDTERAHRLAHTLKGVAASIGATTLSEAARKLENNLNERSTAKFFELIEKVDVLLLDVINAIDAVSRIEVQEMKAEELVLPITKADVQALAKSLQENDSHAVQLINRLSGQVSVGEQKNDLKQLEDLIRRYEFEKAHQLLVSFEPKWKVL